MIVRALDENGDWTFGKGKNDYLVNNSAIAQNIRTRLLSFKDDCFFAKNAGVDWWNLLGGKSKLAVELAVTSIILNTNGVTGLLELSVSQNDAREVLIQYKVATVYSTDQTLTDSVIVGGL